MFTVIIKWQTDLSVFSESFKIFMADSVDKSSSLHRVYGVTIVSYYTQVVTTLYHEV